MEAKMAAIKSSEGRVHIDGVERHVRHGEIWSSTPLLFGIVGSSWAHNFAQAQILQHDHPKLVLRITAARVAWLTSGIIARFTLRYQADALWERQFLAQVVGVNKHGELKLTLLEQVELSKLPD